MSYICKSHRITFASFCWSKSIIRIALIQGEEKIDSLSLWELWLSLIAKSHVVLEGLLQHLSTTTIFSPLSLWNKRPFLLGKAGTYTLTRIQTLRDRYILLKHPERGDNGDTL